ncbi:MAG: acyltransferase family protein [Flavobacteriaceae bacterium]|nr:acyltransferase family protein [Flavobacteriaceae bacterium]
MAERKAWIDQARGLSIFMVVYGHNFPVIEPYIYSFHVPLFFFIAGMFHPKEVNFSVIKRRAKMILVPYFVWAFLLFGFWLAVGKNYGKTSELDLSPIDNFIGIFYAQGGQEYMSWGIPLWFLPCVFILFLLASAIKKIGRVWLQNTVSLIAIILGFVWPQLTGIHLPWSVDVAMVALAFYLSGGLLKKALFGIEKTKLYLAIITMFIIHFVSYYFNTGKVDMYRSIYANEGLFLISGLTGSIFYILLFKAIPVFKFLGYIGRHTIVILATHIRTLTVIKLAFYLVLGTTVFTFTEMEKFILAIAQVVLIIPIIWVVGKYAPILDGKVSKS